MVRLQDFISWSGTRPAAHRQPGQDVDDSGQRQTVQAARDRQGQHLSRWTLQRCSGCACGHVMSTCVYMSTHVDVWSTLSVLLAKKALNESSPFIILLSTACFQNIYVVYFLNNFLTFNDCIMADQEVKYQTQRWVLGQGQRSTPCQQSQQKPYGHEVLSRNLRTLVHTEPLSTVRFIWQRRSIRTSATN